MVINTFKSDNSNMAYINTKHCQIMTTITDRMQKLKLMIERPVVTDHTLFPVVTVTRINSFAYINSFVIHHL